MVKIRVTETTRPREFTLKSGKVKRITLQAALIHIGAEVRQFWLEIAEGTSPFVPGDYQFIPTFQVGQYGDLGLGRAYTLEPIRAKAVA